MPSLLRVTEADSFWGWDRAGSAARRRGPPGRTPVLELTNAITRAGRERTLTVAAGVDHRATANIAGFGFSPESAALDCLAIALKAAKIIIHITTV